MCTWNKKKTEYCQKVKGVCSFKNIDDLSYLFFFVTVERKITYSFNHDSKFTDFFAYIYYLLPEYWPRKYFFPKLLGENAILSPPPVPMSSW